MMINLHNSLIEQREKCVAVFCTEVDMTEIYLFGRDASATTQNDEIKVNATLLARD